jgi:hypothetical protein
MEVFKAKPLTSVALSIFSILSLTFGSGGQAIAVTPTPLAGLDFLTTIPIPNWTTTGANQASTDVWSFDPSTHTLYFADRVNKGVSIVETNTNTYLGTLKVPTCDVAGTRPGSCPSGVLVAPDLHKLVVTDRNTVLTADGATVDLKSIFIYDLRLLTATPVKLDLAAGTNTDELEYDPINHRAYVANTEPPFFLTVVDLLTNEIVDSIPLPSNPEQPRFNPVDGMIYQSIPDDASNGGANSSVLRIDPTKSGADAIVNTLTIGPSCLTRGIDIDPLTNTALVGCAAPGAQILVDLSGNMSIVTTFPGVTGTDTLYFNPNLRRWYTASSNNTAPSLSCPANAASPVVIPVVGVFAAAMKKTPATLVGEECSGTNGHDIGVDPVHNQVYVGVRQAATDPGFSESLANGTPGVLVWHDDAPLAQPKLVEKSSARLTSIASQQGGGRVLFVLSHTVRARLENLSASGTALLNVTTTVGNEVVACDKSGSIADCSGVLQGAALLGGTVLLSNDGTAVASGTIRKGNGGFGNGRN